MQIYGTSNTMSHILSQATEHGVNKTTEIHLPKCALHAFLHKRKEICMLKYCHSYRSLRAAEHNN